MTKLDRWGHALGGVHVVKCVFEVRHARRSAVFDGLVHHIERGRHNPITAFPFATYARGALQLGVPEGCAVGVCEEGRESIDQRVRR